MDQPKQKRITNGLVWAKNRAGGQTNLRNREKTND